MIGQLVLGGASGPAAATIDVTLRPAVAPLAAVASVPPCTDTASPSLAAAAAAAVAASASAALNAGTRSLPKRKTRRRRRHAGTGSVGRPSTVRCSALDPCGSGSSTSGKPAVAPWQGNTKRGKELLQRLASVGGVFADAAIGSPGASLFTQPAQEASDSPNESSATSTKSETGPKPNVEWDAERLYASAVSRLRAMAGSADEVRSMLSVPILGFLFVPFTCGPVSAPPFPPRVEALGDPAPASGSPLGGHGLMDALRAEVRAALRSLGSDGPATEPVVARTQDLAALYSRMAAAGYGLKSAEPRWELEQRFGSMPSAKPREVLARVGKNLEVLSPPEVSSLKEREPEVPIVLDSNTVLWRQRPQRPPPGLREWAAAAAVAAAHDLPLPGDADKAAALNRAAETGESCGMDAAAADGHAMKPPLGGEVTKAASAALHYHIAALFGQSSIRALAAPGDSSWETREADAGSSASRSRGGFWGGPLVGLSGCAARRLLWEAGLLGAALRAEEGRVGLRAIHGPGIWTR